LGSLIVLSWQTAFDLKPIDARIDFFPVLHLRSSRPWPPALGQKGIMMLG
jgi:hypothetical protein